MAPTGHAPMAPPGYAPMATSAYAPITVAPSGSSKIALWATILTGAYAAIGLVTAALTPATVDALKKTLENPENSDPFAGNNPATLLSTPIAIASFVFLALWMQRIRNARKSRGEVVGGPPAVEWWGWFVPLANIVLPFLGMRAITKGRASMGLLVGWWSTYVASSALGLVSGLATFRAIDLSTGELAHPEALDSMAGLAWASGLALAVSWVFLAMIIRVTTRREAEAS